MDHRQIERRVPLLLPDRRVDVDPLILDIEGHALDLVVIDPYFDTMRTRTRSLTHFALYGVVAAASQSIDNGSDDEVGAKIPGEAIEFVNVAFSVTDVNTAIRLPQQGDRLTEIIEPANTLLCFDRDPRRVDLPLELGSALELIAVPEFDRGQAERKSFLGHD